MGNYKVKQYRVSNYRYGLPKGTIIEEDKIDKDRLRFLEPIVEVKKSTKKSNKTKGEIKE